MIQHNRAELHSRSDSELVFAASQKNADAFSELIRRYQNHVYRIAYRFTGNEAVSKELTQEVFIKVYRHARGYNPGKGFTPWLNRIAINHCINYAKKRSRDPLHHTQPYEESAICVQPASSSGRQIEALEEEERRHMVQRALARLPERQRMAIVLLRFENMSYRDIAEVLGCTVSAVESLVHRGMEALKKCIRNAEGPS